MALIKCPECGKEISNKAQACIHCGSPLIEQENKIIIKMVRIDMDKLRTFTVNVFNVNGDKLCSIVEGSTAILKIDHETQIYAQFAKPIIPCRSEPINLQPNKNVRLQIHCKKNLFGGVKKLFISEVDVVDSD